MFDRNREVCGFFFMCLWREFTYHYKSKAGDTEDGKQLSSFSLIEDCLKVPHSCFGTKQKVSPLSFIFMY